MSQTSLFAKSNNPDYIYFDLQTTNVYNNNLDVQPALKFLESRDSPLVPNSGDYHMSVIRFQTDNYNLPVLLAEPDLSSSNASPFNPQRTIHKVAVFTEDAFIPYANPGIVPFNPATINGTPEDNDEFGQAISTRGDGYTVVGAPHAGSVAGEGRVFQFDFQAVPYTKTLLPAATSPQLINEGYGVAINKDGDRILTTGQASGAGRVVYYQSGTPWTQTANHSVGINGHLCISADEFEFDGTDKAQIIVGGSSHSSNAGKVSIQSMTSAGVFSEATSLTGTTGQLFGTAVGMSSNGLIAAATSPKSSSVAGSGYVKIFINSGSLTTPNWSSVTPITLRQPSSFNANSKFGSSVAVSYDGEFIAVGAPSYSSTTTNEGAVVIYRRNAGTNSWSLLNAIEGAADENLGKSVSFGGPTSNNLYASSVSLNTTRRSVNVYIQASAGTSDPFNFRGNVLRTDEDLFGGVVVGSNDTLFLVSSSPALSSVLGGQVDLFRTDDYDSYYIVPDAAKNVPQVAQVFWSPDLTNAPVPPRSQLTGRNTAIFPYYHCHSYEYFIGLVNDTIANASIANWNHLWTSWISTASDTEKQVFLDAAYRSFPTPPLMDWNNNLATLFANQLYNSDLFINNAVPDTNWATNQANNTITGTPERRPPFAFRLAFNSSLYALFNSFPAKERLLNIGGIIERYYVLDFISTGKDAVINNPILNKFVYTSANTSFDVLYRSIVTGAVTIPTPTTGPLTYSYINEFIRQEQELSTIPTWTPINAIVFTSNTLPIVPNQISAVSTIGVEATPASTGNDFALIITDIQSSDGFLPNILYVPSGENRYIDMTGNQPIRNIDINVFYRVKTGQLIPLRLPSGGSASMKLLFKKKIQAEKQKIQFQNLKVKDTGI